MGTFVLHEEIGDKAFKSGIKLFEKTCISECEYRGFLCRNQKNIEL
jgi:hypothetical protein